MNDENQSTRLKWFLCVMNGLFVLSGTILLSIGASFFIAYANINHLLYPHHFTPTTILSIFGLLILVTSFIGFFGALKESSSLIFLFLCCLVILVIMELSASIWIWINKDNMIDIGEIMSQYEENQEARLTLDAMQTSLQCCGSTGPSDWVKYRNHVINDISAPHSCCFSTKNNENNTITCSGYYQKGCSGPLKTFIHENAIKIITSAIIIVSIQIIDLVLSLTFRKTVREKKVAIEMETWQIRNSSIYHPLSNGYNSYIHFDSI